MALKIGRAIRRANEDTYADTDDFPLQFALFIQWVPTLLLVLLAINFYLDDAWVEFIRDVLFIGFNAAFCVYTLNPWRKGIQSQTQQTHPRPLPVKTQPRPLPVKTLPHQCLHCDVADLCFGGCPKDRLLERMTLGGVERRNHLCDGYRQFFQHIRQLYPKIISKM